MFKKEVGEIVPAYQPAIGQVTHFRLTRYVNISIFDKFLKDRKYLYVNSQPNAQGYPNIAFKKIITDDLKLVENIDKFYGGTRGR